MEPIVIFHKDYPLSPTGINADSEAATLELAQSLAKAGRQVFLAAQLPSSFISKLDSSSGVFEDGVHYLDLTSMFDTTKVFSDLEQKWFLNSYHLIVISRALALLESRANERIVSRLFINSEPTIDEFGIEPATVSAVADRLLCVSNEQKQSLIDAGADGAKILISYRPSAEEIIYLTEKVVDAPRLS